VSAQTLKAEKERRMAAFIINLFQFALVVLFSLPVFGQMTVSVETSYDGMANTTTVSLKDVVLLNITENRDTTGICTVIYAEGDIPPHKMEAIMSLENLCAKYNRAQKLADELAKEFGTSRYQALKVVLESAFGWNERYQIYPTKGIIFEAKKIARKYLRLKKKVEKKKMSKRLIRDALGSRR
jgi:hypothetical protein